MGLGQVGLYHLFDLRPCVSVNRSAHKAAMGSADRRVLILGAGYVSKPVISYLAQDSKTYINVGNYRASVFACVCTCLCRYACICMQLPVCLETIFLQSN